MSKLLSSKLSRAHIVDSGIGLDDEAPVTPPSKPELMCPFGEQRSGSSKRKRWAALQERMRARAEREGLSFEKLMSVCCDISKA